MFTNTKIKKPKPVLRPKRSEYRNGLSYPSKTMSIQTKLTIGKPNDRYEKEADRVADKVVSMPEPSSTKGGTTAVQKKGATCTQEEKVQQKPLAASITPWVQRQPEDEVQPKLLQMQEEEKEDEKPIQEKLIQRKEEEQEELQPKLQLQPEEEEIAPKLIQRQTQEDVENPLVQTKRFVSKSDESGTSLENHLSSSKSSGSSLPNDTRSFMESRIGADFSKVKVHTGSSAVQMNKELGAQAFTQGNHVYFNSGKYNPDSSRGKHLLAHELTHTVQQNSKLIRKQSKDKKQETSQKPNKKLNREQVLIKIIAWLQKFRWPHIQKNDVDSLNKYANEMAKNIRVFRASYFKIAKKASKQESEVIVYTVKSIYNNIWWNNQFLTLLNAEVIKNLHNKLYIVYKK